MVIPDGTAGLNNVLDAGFSRPLHIIAKGEEGVGAPKCKNIFNHISRSRTIQFYGL